MSMSESVGRQSGYALFDALVALALGAIVMAAATASLTSLFASKARLGEDFAAREQESSLRQLMTRRIERSADHKLSALAPHADERQFTIRHFDHNGVVQQTAFTIETDARNRRILTIAQSGLQTLHARERVAGPAQAMAFSYVIAAGNDRGRLAGESRDRSRLAEIRLSVQWSAATRPVILKFPIPHYARTICVARPFLRECHS